MEDTLGSRNM